MKTEIKGRSGKNYPAASIRSQGGLKRDIVAIVNDLAEPDDDCMLSDFLQVLQAVLDKHGYVIKKEN